MEKQEAVRPPIGRPAELGVAMQMTAALVLVLLAFVPAVLAEPVPVKDPDGNTLALIFDCSNCKDRTKDKNCETGQEVGFEGGKACGKCMLDANFPTRIPYAYDLQFMGTLKDENGKPLGGKFVRLYLPNTWTVRTRTLDDGMFRLLLGATAERKGKGLVIQLGERVMKRDSKAAEYALYMMPPNYKPCPTDGK